MLHDEPREQTSGPHNLLTRVEDGRRRETLPRWQTRTALADLMRMIVPQ